MNQGGIAGRLVDLVLAVLGRLPASLLVANVGANALFGAISGSASAAAAAVGSMVRDGEEEQGYDPALCGIQRGVCAVGVFGFLPSNALITWRPEAFLCRLCSGGLCARSSVGRLLYCRGGGGSGEKGIQGSRREI